MEDSYTVHRRRKAAAKRREKTPEPSSRSQLVDSSEDEEGARRARMEKMAEASEKMESEKETKVKEDEEGVREAKEKIEKKKDEKSSPAKVEDQSKRRSTEEASLVSGSRTREPDAGEQAKTVRSVKKEVVAKVEEGSLKKDAPKSDEGVTKEVVQETVSKSKEIVEGDVTKVIEVRKTERRAKKKSKERLERHSRSTDSSDMDDRGERSPRRTKSPEGGRIRVKKSSSRTKSGSGDPEIVSKDSTEKHKREKRVLSKQKLEGSEDQSMEKPERRHSRPYSQTEDTDDDPKMKKSETFPRRSSEEPTMKRSATDVKKQIIPLSNDTLIQDFARAQKEYLMREHSILGPDPEDAYEDTQLEPTLRRRKISVAHTENEQEEIAKLIEKPKETETKKRSWFAWLPFFGRKKEKVESEQTVDEKPTTPEKVDKKVEEASPELPEKVTMMDFFRALKDVVAEFKAFVDQNPRETNIMRTLRNRCVAELILIIIYCGLGAFVFRFTEGAFETFYKCGVKRVKRDFLDSLWNYSHNLREDDWKSMARKKLMEFEEQLHTAHEAGVHSYSGQRSWSFLNAVVYCLTVITTIGYGHISPSTTTGRAITIVYAIFGIPMFLIILADFGKLFTRGMKFLWAFVRRLYYTGSCRKVRRTGPVQEVMKGVQLVYDLATFRRPSQINPEDIEEMQRQAQVQAQAQQQPQTVLNLDGNVPDTPGTPAMSAFAIDDEFNLPISVAIFILLGYIFVGATLYYMWEDWGFFESFYFVFISMSTIGFGDYVPKHPMYMMCSIIYLVFGLALTSMCINVVQVMLSDSFKQASQKIGATIGFEVVEEDGTVKPAIPPMVEVADVHVTMKEAESMEKIAPKAKHEDIEL